MYSINAIGKFISNFRDFYNEINTATLTGAIDIVVVEQPDGSFTCSPFHVRFGKLGVLRSREKVVDIEINGEPQDIHMKLGDSGEAFFVEEVPLGFEDEYIPPHLACSPIPQDYFPAHFQDKSKATVTEILEDVPAVVEEKINVKQDVQEETFAIDDISVHQDECVAGTGVDATISSDAYADGSSTNQPVVKTFRAETVDENKETAEKVRKISIVTGEFRPISLEIDLSDDKNTSGTVEEDDPNVDSQSTSVSRKGSYKDCLGPVEDYQKPTSSSSRRKKRKKSLKKKNGQKKGSGSSSSQAEQSEHSETGRDSKEQSEVVEQGNQNDCQVTCSHLGGVIINNNTSTVFSSANCETCRKTPANPTVTISNVDFQSSSCELLKAAANNLVELSRMQNSSTETDFHFFSDTEITPGCSPSDSRPSSPVQSDTEFEMNRQSKSVSTEVEDGQTGHGVMQQSWRWGELPTLPRNMSTQSLRASAKEKIEPEAISSSDEEVQKQQQEAAEAAQRSMLSGMFSFMKKTKRIRHNPESEGIYLSDLNSDELDPEVAALYFPTSYKQGQNVTLQATQGPSQRHRDEEDAESGNGTSLPQSPNSVEGAICGPKSLDSDFEEPKHSIFEQKSYGEISMSLCGGLSDSGPSEDNFLQHLVSHSDLVRDPKLIENPNLVIRLNGKYYNWRTAGPLIMSLVIFQKPLPQNVIDTLSADYMPLKKGQKKDVKASSYSSWFYWRRPSEPKKMNAGPVGMEDLPIVNQDKFTILKEVVPVSTVEVPISTEAKSSTFQSSVIEGDASIPVDIPKPSGFSNHNSDSKGTEGDESEIIQGSSPKPNSKDSKEEGYSGSNSSDESDSGRTKPQNIKKPLEKRSYYDHPEKYRKTLRLSSDQIASLNLNEGANEVVFSVTTAYQGTTRCKCHIYRWRFDDKIVISDIDGTITKSDVLGHILPIVGKDWAQSGVAQLFTKIKNNGYKLLYLSARAIGQARVTREYLRSIKQGDLCLPEGPLLLNPTSLISAFHREVIEKKPEEFKISCLRDILALFPENCKPFYAGYGNRINDVWAYRAVGIPIFRIFTINHKGELKHELTQTFQSSYSNMSYIVDQMFPPPPEDTAEDFSNFVYWRDPIQDIELDPSVVMVTPVNDMAADLNRKKSVTASSGH